MMLLCFLLAVVAVVCLIVAGICSLFRSDSDGEVDGSASGQVVRFKDDISGISVDCPNLDVRLLTVNEYSRPGTRLEKVNGLVIHYVGNPGTTAMQNRNYFESLAETGERSASCHFVVGLDGEIVQCIPTSEISYCSNNRNDDTVAIEVCHKKADGKFSKETYESLVHLTAFLCCKFDLNLEDVIRHYDVTGKICPKYYVDHEDKWIAFKKDVAAYIEENAYKE